MSRVIESDAAAVAELFPAIYLRLHRRRSKGSYRPTAEAMAVLLHFETAGPLTVTEAARHMQRSQSTMSAIIDRLQRRGMIERMADRRDRRRTLVWLTPVGIALLAEERHVLDRGLLGGALGGMTAVERSNLVCGMRALVRAVKEDSK